MSYVALCPDSERVLRDLTTAHRWAEKEYTGPFSLTGIWQTVNEELSELEATYVR